jgi:hypothetical protein
MKKIDKEISNIIVSKYIAISFHFFFINNNVFVVDIKIKSYRKYKSILIIC